MLYEINYCQGIFVDACIRDETGRLLLLSAFGRDTAIKELIARMHLGSAHHDGLSELGLKPQAQQHGAREHRVIVGNPKDLDKLTGRLPKCVYGNLNHLWLYNPVISAPQKGADVAWVIEQVPKLPSGERVVKLSQLDGVMANKIKARVWEAINQLSDIPLLPHWRDSVIGATRQMILTMGQHGNEQVSPHMSVPIGDFVVLKVTLDQAQFAKIVTDLVRSGVLTLEPPTEPQNPAESTLGHEPVLPLALASSSVQAAF